MKKNTFNEIKNSPSSEYEARHESFITSSTGFSSQQKLIYEIRDLDFDADGEKDILCVSLRFDHDLMDGAPITRFGASFVNYLESSDHLQIAETDA